MFPLRSWEERDLFPMYSIVNAEPQNGITLANGLCHEQVPRLTRKLRDSIPSDYFRNQAHLCRLAVRFEDSAPVLLRDTSDGYARLGVSSYPLIPSRNKQY